MKFGRIAQTVPHRNKSNELAETLLIFSKRHRQAEADPTGLAALIELLFLHYVINTNGPIPDAEGVDPFVKSDRYSIRPDTDLKESSHLSVWF